MKAFLASILKDIGEGRLGNSAQTLYWLTHDHALWIGLVFGFLDVAILGMTDVSRCDTCANADFVLRWLADILIIAGLMVGMHAAEPPDVPRRTWP